MMDALDNRPSTSFYLIGGAAFLWNLIGLMFYYAQVTMTPEAIESFTEGQQEFFVGIPVWATSAHAIAVNAGILGCLALLFRKAWAIPLFAVSLAGVVVQDLHAFVLSNGLDVFGSQGLILPAIVVAISVSLVLYSRRAKSKRWLS